MEPSPIRHGIRHMVLADAISEWEPRDRPHCSNCQECRVRGDPEEPEAYCRVRDQSAPLLRIIRPKHSWQFKANCLSFVPAEDFPPVQGWKDGKALFL